MKHRPCLWLDGALTKACRVLRARLAPLGWRIVCRTRLPDIYLAWLARRMGCIVVSTDSNSKRYNWIHIPQWYVERKSARDLATHILKNLARYTRKWGR